MKISPVIIGAPFGNYLQPLGCTPTLGTFTVENRGGLLYRVWRCARTLRPLWSGRGWINQLGLPNPGLQSLLNKSHVTHFSRMPRYDNRIISVKGFSAADWEWLVRQAWSLRSAGIELNISCPNVDHVVDVRELKFLKEFIEELHQFDGNMPAIIAKLPPVRWMLYADILYDWGVRWFHCCNTIPTAKGGISGAALKPYSLWAVTEIKSKYPEATVIGGGGIYDCLDAHHYWEAGADHVAVASALLNPFRWSLPKRIMRAKG